MNSDLIKAEKIYKEGGYTCVLCKGDKTYTSKKRGILPLVSLLSDGICMTGYSAADKIVGRAAAFLYILMEVHAVYAQVMSEAAYELLTANNIHAYCDIRVKSIINRKGTGPCPMEEAVCDIDEPYMALDAIKNKLSAMTK